MQKQKLWIILGSDMPAVSLAKRLKRLSPLDEVIVIYDGNAPMSLAPDIAYWFDELRVMWEEKPVTWPDQLKALGISVYHTDQVTVDPKAQKLYLSDDQVLFYDGLFIATYQQQKQALFPDLSYPDTWIDADSEVLLSKAQLAQITGDVVILGSSPISVQLAEYLVKQGAFVHIITDQTHLFPNLLDQEMAALVQEVCSRQGIALSLNQHIQEIIHDHELILSDGRVVTADHVIVLHQETPVLVYPQGISKTLSEDQDALEQLHIYPIESVGHPHALMHKIWALTNKVLEKDTCLDEALDTKQLTEAPVYFQCFDLEIASFGIPESELADQDDQDHYQAIHTYPTLQDPGIGSLDPIALKVIMDPQGMCFGAQVIGKTGVWERVSLLNMLRTYQKALPSLKGIDFAYHPQKTKWVDPLQQLGAICDLVLTGQIPVFSWQEVDHLVAEDAYLLDVREAVEVEQGTINTSHHIPLSELSERIQELPKDQIIYVFCQVGLRGYRAVRLLQAYGLTAKNLEGGFKTYQQGIKTVWPVVAPHQNIDQGVDTVKETVKQVVTEDRYTIDATVMQCPGPIIQVNETMQKLQEGETMCVLSSDAGFYHDVCAWAEKTGNSVYEMTEADGLMRIRLQKGGSKVSAVQTEVSRLQDGVTMVVFSGDMDKVLASMIIASGAAAMGKPVTLFFTFWGLSALKKQPVKKKGFAKMFDIFLPKNASKLPLSSMNMGGMGRRMMNQIMKEKHVTPLPEMIWQAHQLGVKFIACTMSMDVMGITEEELFDFVDYGGVATFLGASETASMQLFI